MTALAPNFTGKGNPAPRIAFQPISNFAESVTVDEVSIYSLTPGVQAEEVPEEQIFQMQVQDRPHRATTSQVGISLLTIGAIVLSVLVLLSIADDVSQRKLHVSGTLILMLVIGAIGLAWTAVVAKKQAD